MLGHVGGDGVAVVADVDMDRVVGSGVSRQGYRGSTCLDGVFQQIGDHMGNEAFVGI